jgi:hypothetical protein
VGAGVAGSVVAGRRRSLDAGAAAAAKQLPGSFHAASGQLPGSFHAASRKLPGSFHAAAVQAEPLGRARGRRESLVPMPEESLVPMPEESLVPTPEAAGALGTAEAEAVPRATQEMFGLLRMSE